VSKAHTPRQSKQLPIREVCTTPPSITRGHYLILARSAFYIIGNFVEISYYIKNSKTYVARSNVTTKVLLLSYDTDTFLGNRTDDIVHTTQDTSYSLLCQYHYKAQYQCQGVIFLFFLFRLFANISKNTTIYV
jgi:hypothetical protein